MQTSFPLIGSVTRPAYLHPQVEVVACKTMGSALGLALTHAKMTQEHAAERMGCTAGYLSLILKGKRNAPESIIRRVVAITGSLAPVQWICAQFGGLFYADEVEARKAALRSELATLEAAA